MVLFIKRDVALIVVLLYLWYIYLCTVLHCGNNQLALHCGITAHWWKDVHQDLPFLDHGFCQHVAGATDHNVNARHVDFENPLPVESPNNDQICWIKSRQRNVTMVTSGSIYLQNTDEQKGNAHAHRYGGCPPIWTILVLFLEFFKNEMQHSIRIYRIWA